MNIDWGTLGTIIIAVSAGGGTVTGIVHHMLRGGFVGRAQHEALANRLSTLEQRMGVLPDRDAVGALLQRVGEVSTHVAVAQTTIDGVNTGLKRVEHLVMLLLKQKVGDTD